LIEDVMTLGKTKKGKIDAMKKKVSGTAPDIPIIATIRGVTAPHLTIVSPYRRIYCLLSIYYLLWR